MKTDYPELERKEIEVYTEDGWKYIGIVVGVNYHVGITVVDKELKTHPYLCLIYKQHAKVLGENKYREIFQTTVKYIKTGKFDHNYWEFIGNVYIENKEAFWGPTDINKCPWR